MQGGFLHPEKILRDIGGIKPGMSIADFGCGSGYFSLPLARLVGVEGQVTAIDVLSSALESVTARARNSGLLNIKTVRANLEIPASTGLPDVSQDVVIAANLLFQSKKKNAIMKEASRILKLGGKLVVMDWDPEALVGPPKNLRVNPREVTSFAQANGLRLEKDFRAGFSHYGMVFSK